MLVEDDDNLREIYEARLLAEGYEIVNARDGEEALSIAIKEKPDLIIADVMMPRISGFDMLDILRSTPNAKDTKIIMMTALSQAEDKARAEKLGVDRYLVKSQVTLEDVVRVTSEVLNGTTTPATASPAPAAETPTTTTSVPTKIDISTPNSVVTKPVTVEPTQPLTKEEILEYTPTVGGPVRVPNSNNDGIVIHEKTIKPIHDIITPDSSIASLTALEAKETANQPLPTDSTISPTGQIFKTTNSGIDPNSVAL